MIKNATFTSVWDDGLEFVSSCKVNMETKEVFDIEAIEAEGLDILVEEYITIEGINYPVSADGDCTEYWY